MLRLILLPSLAVLFSQHVSALDACLPARDVTLGPQSYMQQQLPDRKLNQDQLVFSTIGDWGVVDSGNADVNSDQIMGLSAMMDQRAPLAQWNFVLSLGDHFYPDGIDHHLNPRWQTSFEDVFRGANLKNLYWYAVLGNHDFEDAGRPLAFTNPRAQIDYTFSPANRHHRWCMPHYDYAFRYVLKDFAVTFVAVNTTAMLHQCQGGCQAVTYATCPKEEYRPALSCSQENLPTFAEQMSFLRSTIHKAKAQGDWVFVFTHHPLASLGKYGGGVGRNWGNPVLREELTELLTELKVDATMAGHEHMTELLMKGGRMPVIITGRAGKTNVQKLPCIEQIHCDAILAQAYPDQDYRTQFVSLDTAVSELKVTRKNLNISFIGIHGQELFQLELSRD